MQNKLRNLWQHIKNLNHYRNWFLFLGVLAAVLASYWSDPDGGLSTALAGVGLLQGLVAVAIVHVIRKALTPYDEADWQTLFSRAGQGPTGAGLALVAQAIVVFALLSVFAPRAHAALAHAPQQSNTLPQGFALYGKVLRQEQQRYWPNHPKPAILAALIEQESCPSLTSRQCWNPAASLNNAREEGAGLGQLTRTYHANGKLRFDSLTAVRTMYAKDLQELSWANIYQRPDLQIRAMVLMNRDAANAFRATPPMAMLAFADAAYNGGTAGVQRERRACKLTAGCDSSQWFGHVEHHCLKSRKALYGKRSACDINREHVRQVLQVRMFRYVTVMK